MKATALRTPLVARKVVETARIIQGMGLPIATSEPEEDPLFWRELDLVRRTEQRFRTRGIDVRTHLHFDITHRILREWLEESDRLVDHKPGRSDLRRHRRRGILRIVEGKDLGMPLDVPPLAATPATPWRDAQWRTLPLRDELEWISIIFIPISHPAVRSRPVVDVLSHRQVRAILGWPASTLDHYISMAPHFIGGLRKKDLSADVRGQLDESAPIDGRVIARPNRTLQRVEFDTRSFALWLAANQN